jgi:hypothetical protein
VSPKSKVEVARDHLEKAQEEALHDDLRNAVQWSFAALEAAIDAVSEVHGINIGEKHWRRSKAARQLHESGVFPTDLEPLHELLNDTRKAIFYEGEDPDLGDLTIEEVLIDVETAVKIAESEAK